jgi:hypothetical protein
MVRVLGDDYQIGIGIRDGRINSLHYPELAIKEEIDFSNYEKGLKIQKKLIIKYLKEALKFYRNK